MMQIETIIVPDHITPEEYLQEEYPASLYNQLGAGMYATVFQHYGIKDEVVKISHGHDSGYRSWVEVITLLGENNPYLPRIFEVKLFKWDDKSPNYTSWCTPGETHQDRFVVRMEKLDRIQYDYRNRHAINFGEYIESLAFDDKAIKKMKKQSRKDLLMLLRICKENYGGTFDLHWGNYMMRNGQVVITDPFS